MHPAPSLSYPSTHHIYTVLGSRFEIPQKYKIIKPIGSGSFGVVCSAECNEIDPNTNQAITRKVAIKKITNIFSNLIETRRTLREIKLLRFFNHPNIISIFDVFVYPLKYDSFSDLYIVSELMNTDLHQIINSKQSLSDEHVQYFIYQLLRGLKYIHSSHTIHRDLSEFDKVSFFNLKNLLLFI